MANGPIQSIPHDARPKAPSRVPGAGHNAGAAPGSPPPISYGTPKPPKKPVHASTPHSSSSTTTTTPEDDATAQANAAIAPQLQGLQSQQALYDAQQKAYQNAMQGFYSALAPYLAGISGQQSAAYNSAAGAMGDIAHGYAGALGQAAQGNADATTAALQRGGQTQAIGAAQAQANPGANGLTDPFAAQHGGIQGTSFAQEGAAKAADSANKPAVWAAQGRDSMTEAIQKAMAGDQTWADKISQVYATVPALRQQILTQIQDQKLKEQQLADSEQNTKFNQDAKRETLQQAAVRLGIQADNTKFNQKATVAKINQAQQRINIESQKAARSAMQSDRSYALALASFGLRSRALQIKALAQDAKAQNGGFTPSQMNRFKTDAADVLSLAKSAKARPTYDSIMEQMLKRHVPISMAQNAIHSYDPTLQGSPIDTQRLKDYNATTGASSSPKANDVVGLAKAYLGTPYVWGGTTPGKALDCSGFTQAAYARVGIKIPRTTYDQVKAGRGVKLNQLQPGDLVFTEPGKNGPNHVGMYIGNGQIQESPHTGTVNSIISLQSFLGGGFVAARRYLG
jgi:cell wall-associated NlpC family hydrolase